MKRGIEVYKKINSSYKIKIVIAKKYLDYSILNYLKKKNINYIIIRSLKDKRLKKIKNFDLGIACGFPLIFNNKFLKKAKYGFLNCHAGKIPEYRGGSPLHWQLINNEKYFWISVLTINKGIDMGNLIEEKKFLIKDNYGISDLQKISDDNFPKLIIKSIKKIMFGKKFKKINEKNSKVWPQRYSVNSYLDFASKDNNQIIKLIRSCKNPYPAFGFIKGKKIVIRNAKISNKKLPIGVISKQKNKKYIGCKIGSILLN